MERSLIIYNKSGIKNFNDETPVLSFYLNQIKLLNYVNFIFKT